MLGKVVLSAVAMLALAGSAMAQDKTTLRFANIMDAAGIERFKPVLDEFHAAYPDIEVKMEGVAGSGSAVYPDLLRTSMASGDPPPITPRSRASKINTLPRYTSASTADNAE